MKEGPIPSKHPGAAFSLSWARESGVVDQLEAQMRAKLARKRRARRRKAVGAAVALLFAATGFWAVPWMRSTASITTPVAQRRSLVLPDGSTAELNGHTTILTDFRYGRRIVRLEDGEAFFAVRKDAAHPFLVETAAGTVRVTGTQFNVRVAGPARAEVILAEGAIVVEKAGTTLATLQPGMQCSIADGATRTKALDRKELAAVSAWRQGRLVLDDLTLAEAAARFAHYHGKTISVDPRVAALAPGGSYPLDDLAGFLEALGTILPVSVKAEADGYAIAPR